nr:retrovirus-related Pol polyprotein from transposon TNT 1-94 [Tanacetum cinerariifolium]
QTEIGKENSNPFMADSLPIAVLLTMLAVKLLLFMAYYYCCLLYVNIVWSDERCCSLNAARKKVVVTEDILRQDLRLDDADGVECLPTEEIFAELARMGYEKPPLKLTFYKAFFSAQWMFLIHTLVQCVSAKRTAWNEFNCFMALAVICLATGRKFNFSKYIFDSMVRNVDNPSKFFMYPRFLQVLINNQVDDLSSHTIKYTSPALTQKVFTNIRRIGKGFSGVETSLFATMLVQPQAASKEEDEEDEVAALEQDKVAQALDIFKLKSRVKKLEKKRGAKSLGLKRLRKGRIERKDDDNATAKEVNAAEPIVFHDKEVTMTMLKKQESLMGRWLKGCMMRKLNKLLPEKSKNKMTLKELKSYNSNMIKNKKTLTGMLLHSRCKRSILTISRNTKVRPIFEREYKKVQTFLKPDRDEEPTKKRVAKETLLHESFMKLRAEVEVSCSESTQETPTIDPKEISEKDVQNMLQIDPLSEFKVEPLQVKYPLTDWEIHSKGSRSYWKIITVGGITEAYKNFEDMLKGFDREDLDALWRLVKEKFSTSMPTEDKEKALWVELKILYEPNAADVFWKLQRYMHDPTKLQVNEDCEMARDLVMKIFMEANKPKSRRSKNDAAAEVIKKLLLVLNAVRVIVYEVANPLYSLRDKDLLKSKDPQCTIVSIRTDNDRKFDNEVQFREFCNANGITHNFSAPRTHQSNGVVEMKNRTLQEMSRTMLNEQSLPQKFWCNAVDTSTYILNQILIRAILGKTPYELLRGRKPTLDYFRVFGSKCFILNTKNYLTKFDPKSYKGIFLGYSQYSKAYIILNKHTRKVKESLNVTFDETPPPFKTLPLVDDDLDEKEAIKVIKKKNLENDIVDETLEIDEIVNIKESRNHLLENVIGTLNKEPSGTTHLRLWYPKGTGIKTVVYADSDHAGDYVDRKSTRGICTFVGCCLTSWFSKKQTALAISTTEDDYGACAFTDRWSLDELLYGVPLDGPYQTNPPSPDDIISSI